MYIRNTLTPNFKSSAPTSQASSLIRIANEPEQRLRLARSISDHDRAGL